MATARIKAPALLWHRARWAAQYPAHARQAPDLSDVQDLVHLAGRLTADEEKQIADRLFDQSCQVYQAALQEEVNKVGCSGTMAVVPSEGPELSALRERADWAAATVVRTYNDQLAKAIWQIGEDTPTANRHVYASRLFYAGDSWDDGYWQLKAVQISQVETMTTISAASADFYQNNDIPTEAALVVPYESVCAICADIVQGNPYRSADDVFRHYLLPAHLGCPHYVETVPQERLTNDECRDLWAGAIGSERAALSAVQKAAVSVLPPGAILLPELRMAARSPVGAARRQRAIAAALVKED
jgi:hypothetical protein